MGYRVWGLGFRRGLGLGLGKKRPVVGKKWKIGGEIKCMITCESREEGMHASRRRAALDGIDGRPASTPASGSAAAGRPVRARAQRRRPAPGSGPAPTMVAAANSARCCDWYVSKAREEGFRSLFSRFVQSLKSFCSGPFRALKYKLIALRPYQGLKEPPQTMRERTKRPSKLVGPPSRKVQQTSCIVELLEILVSFTPFSLHLFLPPSLPYLTPPPPLPLLIYIYIHSSGRPDTAVALQCSGDAAFSGKACGT